MLRGRWLSRNELDARLAAVVASYRTRDDWFAQMPALPGRRTVEYEVLWNRTQIGADRFAVSGDEIGLEIRHAQSVLKDQFEEKRISSTRTVDGASQSIEVTVWSGSRQGTVSATHDGKTLELGGTLPSGGAVSLREPMAIDAYLGTGILPHALTFAPRLMALPIGGELQLEVRTPEFEEVFEVSRTEVGVTRSDDTFAEVAGQHIRVRAFSLTLTTGQYSTPATLTIDEDGVPVTLDLVFQQGHKVFRRVE
jgi:hypothetical protein